MKKAVIILGLLALLYFAMKYKEEVKNAVNKGLKLFGESDARAAVLAVKQQYGEQIARTVEKMFRLETSHFKSQQYIKTGTAGMEVGKWPGLPKLPTIQMHDADKSDGIDTFVVWNPKDFALYLAAYIVRHGGNFARWYSLNPASQESYRKKVSSIKPKFV